MARAWRSPLDLMKHTPTCFFIEPSFDGSKAPSSLKAIPLFHCLSLKKTIKEKMRHQSLVILAMASAVSGLDIAIDYIQCDTSLAAYAEPNGLTMACDGSSRCTMGQNATLSGKLIYDGLLEADSNTTMGYATGKLQLMTVDYDLFHFLPFDFCGSWLYDANFGCPEDGIYHFQIPYTLPDAEGVNAWFASGWQGVSYLKVYSDEKATSPMLAHCKVHFKTFVTDAGEKNWYTLPSAAQATIVLFAILGALFMIVLCMACRPANKPHPTDPEYGAEYKNMDEDNKTVATRADEEAAETIERAQALSMKMNYTKI